MQSNWKTLTPLKYEGLAFNPEMSNGRLEQDLFLIKHKVFIVIEPT